MVHPKVRRFLLLVDAGFRRRGRRGSGFTVHRAGRIGYADQAIRCSSDSSGVTSDHVLGVCYHRVSYTRLVGSIQLEDLEI